MASQKGSAFFDLFLKIQFPKFCIFYISMTLFENLIRNHLKTKHGLYKTQIKGLFSSLVEKMQMQMQMQMLVSVHFKLKANVID